jgi:hypothetical protein
MRNISTLSVAGAICLALNTVALAATYYVDGQGNDVGSDLHERSVTVTLPAPGEYTFVLSASDFRENLSNPNPQRHVVVLGGSGWGDYRTFTLRGRAKTNSDFRMGRLCSSSGVGRRVDRAEWS